ncbi:MAG: hypothetical protein HY785_10775 [Oscillatoriophycideae cyanobacterium NC_groundwater_1537_Pr4_S-0.65um_50_18]|nr:hypothetical protein [Oscillatoriophycideae cyanobacterium NC_groundwater_1537_Pr4_S-0.65um_50_18]
MNFAEPTLSSDWFSHAIDFALGYRLFILNICNGLALLYPRRAIAEW